MPDNDNYWLRKRQSRRTVLGGAATAAVGVTALGLVGCGDDDDDVGQTPGTGNTPQPGASPTEQVQQERGGRLVWATNADMNPQSLPYSPSVWLFPIQWGVYDYISKYVGFTLESEARMAERWEQVSPTQLTLTLRNGLKWHNGEDVTAEDIVFNIENVAKSRSGINGVAARAKATATDARTVSIASDDPLPGIFDVFNYMPVAHPRSFGEELTTARTVIGSGPFRFGEWVPGSHVRLERNTEWWKADRPFLDEIEWKLYPQTSIATAVEAGEIQYTRDLEATEAVRIGRGSNHTLVPGSEGYTFLYFAANVTHPVLADKRIRQAINHSINRQRIADEVLSGITGPKVLPFPDYSPGYDQGLHDSVDYNLDKARTLLQQAGYNSNLGEIPLSFSAALVATEGIMLILQNDLRQLGVATRIDKQESSVYINNYIQRTLPGGMSFLLGYAGMTPSTYMLGPIVPPNFMHYNDDSYKTWLGETYQKANVESTSQAALKEFNEFMIEEAFMMPVVSNTTPAIIHNRVLGYNVNVVDEVRLEELSLARA